MTPCPTCQWPHHAARAITVTCVKCGTTVNIAAGVTTQAQTKKNTRDHSRLINWIRWLRQPGEIGVGDTVERLLANVGGRKLKQKLEQLGMNCGCPGRQSWLNRKFPYDSEK